jgi:hypothetical protein
MDKIDVAKIKDKKERKVTEEDSFLVSKRLK